MADYVIQDTTLTAIADAIREKAGGTAALTPAAMVTAIAGIETGGGLPDGVSAIASGTFTPTSNIISRYSIAHGLGVIPSFFIVTAVDTVTYGNAFVHEYLTRINCEDSGSYTHIGLHVISYLPTSLSPTSSVTTVKDSEYSTTEFNGIASSTNIMVNASSTIRLISGTTYRWVAGVIDGLE